MTQTKQDLAPRWATICMSVLAAATLAACGGSDGPPTSGGGGGGGGGGEQSGVEEEGCFDNCKKFLTQLVEDFASSVAPTGMSARATGPAIRVSGDTVEFDVAAVQKDVHAPGQLNEEFPVSNKALSYLLKINKATGEITIDNRNGATYVLKAFEEASYFQDIDYAKTDLADKNKAHYAYVAFNPKIKANVIQKDANLRRQWKKVDGSDYPSPGVSLSMGTHYQDCPDQMPCDDIMLTANPSEFDDGGDTPVSGDPHISATVDGVAQNGTLDVSGSWLMDSSGGNSMTASGAGTPPIVWSIQHLKAAVGEYSCGDSGGPVIVFTNPGVIGSNPMDAITNSWKIMSTTAHKDEGGACTINVTKADENSMEGTFTATTVALGTGSQVATFNVTAGSFNVKQ